MATVIKWNKVFYGLFFGLAFLTAIFFRFVKLGYSEFVSDEVDVLGFLFTKKSFFDFLVEQKKGPGQFVVTYLVNFFVNNLNNIELIHRFPYAVIGIVFVIVAFLLARRVYGEKSALISLIFISLSGLLIAMSRYLQFPPFVLALGCLSILLTCNQLSENKSSVKIPILNGLVSGAALLFHYDALAFIIPTTVSLLIARKLKSLFVYISTVFITSMLFYIRFFLHPAFSKTLNFLLFERVFSDTKNSLSISLSIFSLYHSKEFLVIMVMGSLLWINTFSKKLDVKRTVLFALALALTVARAYVNKSYVYNLSVFTWALFIILYLYDLYKLKGLKSENLMEIWLLTSFFTYFVFIKFPLTHIYNFLIPLFIIISTEFYKFFREFPLPAASVLSVLIISSASFNYFAFIDTDREYPWKKKTYVFGKMYEGVARKEMTRGVFGLTYKRGWKEIRAEVDKLKLINDIKTYDTNEKPSISDFYLKYGSNDISYNTHKPDLYIKINSPYSVYDAVDLPGNSIVRRDRYKIYLVRK
ncbi:hypothetical protein A2716_04040 [candidate division WWE3 bacterium RIFCSPHIGHO2_01_FULL_40_23]|uniref:Glycosyltransferase RgtA/B/C/D-like domain-containing protein n=1 Tax=candidate division WWE3 bacterium RIFCSPLOWO2_01_FULL_41_18 TaxID=1802625 RepID=A0A1F4VD29_UNCKA|nr:MAG: hypothetical protein A2716_04040 [candidate division WWE3 bacterium RIFCSPHIGHO2_01_FULL_40_23]OGC55047.1 MAG: hypothetical protein A3A78_03650 [candidate division WWE3 bacterium RIFCSPLOWO2_01_FULL_41_18]